MLFGRYFSSDFDFYSIYVHILLAYLIIYLHFLWLVLSSQPTLVTGRRHQEHFLDTSSVYRR